MIKVDIENKVCELDGNIHDMAKEIVMALGTLCDQYNSITSENVTPYQFIDLGVMLLRQDEQNDTSIL